MPVSLTDSTTNNEDDHCNNLSYVLNSGLNRHFPAFKITRLHKLLETVKRRPKVAVTTWWWLAMISVKSFRLKSRVDFQAINRLIVERISPEFNK
ncbi:hypothetical protein DAPPUDRAFT_233092 [Daphnia pulex]|uniref:Uncharacterized protein n=1 Tax=Daphnia pulex TaxID=6669 RepID=E9FT61_DAPPU|nr:hypothetical protein DAPPUDRAFT_233092 [Daphnia pulex]|eukprot:EFX89317.1 hypothetical protein DAPPUDRAFT_233092 [Daphnia pulex]